MNVDVERYSRFLPSIAFGMPEIAKEAAGHEFHGNQYSGGGGSGGMRGTAQEQRDYAGGKTDEQHPVAGMPGFHAGDIMNAAGNLVPNGNGQFNALGELRHDGFATPVPHPELGNLWNKGEVDRAKEYDSYRERGLSQSEARSVMTYGYVMPNDPFPGKSFGVDLTKEGEGHAYHGNQWSGGGERGPTATADAHHELAGALRARANDIEAKAANTSGEQADRYTGHAHGLREAADLVDHSAGDHAAVHGGLQQRADDSRVHSAASGYAKGTSAGYKEALSGLAAVVKEIVSTGTGFAQTALAPVLHAGGE